MEEQKQPEVVSNLEQSNNLGDKEQAHLSKHEKKQLKKQQKHEEKQERHETKYRKEQKKSIGKYSIISIVIILVVLGSYFFVIKPIKEFKPIHTEAYHWHANLVVSICGQPAQIRCASSMCGPMTLHHHNDDIIHIEGSVIAKEEDISLGKFFDGLNLEFSETNLLGKENGDLCSNGQTGIVKMFVNGQQNYEYKNYILKKCESANIKQECEKIELKFE